MTSKTDTQNDTVESLLRLRPHAGNPRQPQQFIQTYGTCRSLLWECVLIQGKIQICDTGNTYRNYQMVCGIG